MEFSLPAPDVPPARPGLPPPREGTRGTPGLEGRWNPEAARHEGEVRRAGLSPLRDGPEREQNM